MENKTRHRAAFATAQFSSCVGLSSAVKCYECTSVLNANGGCGSSDFRSSAATEKDNCEFCQVFSMLQIMFTITFLARDSI